MKPSEPQVTTEPSGPAGLPAQSKMRWGRWTYWANAGTFIWGVGFLFYLLTASEIGRTGATVAVIPRAAAAAAGFSVTTLYWLANAYFAYSPVNRDNWQCLAGSKTEARVIMHITLTEWAVGGSWLRAQMRIFYMAFVLPTLLLTLMLVDYGLDVPLEWLAGIFAIAVIAMAGVPRRRVHEFLCTTAYARERGLQPADFPRSPLRLFASPLYFRDAALDDADSPLNP